MHVIVGKQLKIIAKRRDDLRVGIKKTAFNKKLRTLNKTQTQFCDEIGLNYNYISNLKGDLSNANLSIGPKLRQKIMSALDEQNFGKYFYEVD